MKVSSTFSKVVESRGKASGRPPQRAELSCAHKSAGGGPRGNPRRGFPLFFWLVRVRRYVGRWLVACPAVRPHFFGACPKKRCRAAKEKRFFYPGGSTIRVSATSRWTIRSSPDLGEGAGTCAPFPWVEVSYTYCPFHPISLLLRKETGWSPKEMRLWVPPRQLFGPARLSHGLEAPTSQPTASS